MIYKVPETKQLS